MGINQFLNTKTIVTCLFFIPCFIMAALLLFDCIEIINIFVARFWEFLAGFDPTIKQFHPLLQLVLFLSIILSIIGMRLCSHQTGFLMLVMTILCCIIIICSWTIEWIIVRNIQNITDIMLNVTEQYELMAASTFPLDVYNDTNTPSNAFHIMRLIPCCSYSNCSTDYRTYKMIIPAIEYLADLGTLPLACKYAIRPYIENNIMSAIGISADLRIICIMLLINIIIICLVAPPTESL